MSSKQSQPTTANVASSASNVTLFASSPGAKVRIIKNESTALLYVKYGVTASSTSYTQDVPAGYTYEFPQPVYTGQVDGIWVSANGNARTTEVA